jgi:hypothetical protein
MRRQGLTTADRLTLQASLLGGHESQDMTDLLPIVEECLIRLGIKNIIAKEKGVFGSTKSLAIDSRTGQIYDLENIIQQSFDPRSYSICAMLRGSWSPITADPRSLR